MTHQGESPEGRLCPPEHVLEACAMGHLTAEREAELKAHAGDCTACAAALAAFAEARNGLQQILATSNELGPECPTEDLLGQYMDRSLTDEAHEQLEAHLADCQGCLGRLKALWDEVVKVCDPEVEVTVVERRTDGELVPFAVPVRKAEPGAEQGSGAREISGQEERKGRLSSG